jgi:hypothetical protein
MGQARAKPKAVLSMQCQSFMHLIPASSIKLLVRTSLHDPPARCVSIFNLRILPSTRRCFGLVGPRLQDGTAPPVSTAACRPLIALQSAQNSAGIQTLLDVSASVPLWTQY